ncbi:hypothetical protein [Staphylospora marina]|uniref:hypothetical protein n=1 Tax=Staphylospora marina TaxID=2490858 RepID=UPI000F5BF43E|nr:hypothetical protein [Staphylospora marina]
MDSREQNQSFVQRAREEFEQHIPWWQERKPLKQLPAKLEEMLEKGDPAFVEEALKFAALSLGEYGESYWENGSWVHERVELYKEEIDREDGSWLWTLYLKRHPLVHDALTELLRHRDYWETGQMVDRWFQTGKSRGWWQGHWNSRIQWSSWYLSTFIPLGTVYFRYMKAMFKDAEKREAETPVWALLAYRFDVERPSWRYWYVGEKRIYGPDTHHYLRRRAWRTLKQLGEAASPEYVKRAAALLKWYSDEDALGEMRMQFADPSILNFTRLWVFNQILFRNSRRFVPSSPRRFKAMEGASMADWPDEREEAFPKLWDRHPELLWELVKEAKATPVIRFAARALRLGNREFLNNLSDEELQGLLQDRHASRKAVGAEWILERLSPDRPSFERWWKLVLTGDWGILESAKAFVRKHVSSWDSGIRQKWLSRLIEEIRKEEGGRFEIEAAVSVIHEAFAESLPELATVRVAEECLASSHESVRKLAALVLEKLDPKRHPFTGRDLLPFLGSKVPVVREAARNVLERRFASLSLDAEVLAEMAMIPGDDHREAFTRFLENRILWLIPHQKELIRLLWVRMLRSDTPEDLRGYIREELLGRLFFKELAETPLEKVFRLLEHQEIAMSEFGTRLFLLKNPGPEDLGMDDWIRMAHNPVARARKEARARIAVIAHRFREEEWVRLAETEWEDTRNWVMERIQAWSPEEITPALIYGLMDTSLKEIQQFAMDLVKNRQRELDVRELMLRATEHPDLTVQEYALELAAQLDWDAGLVRKLDLFFRTVLFRVHTGRKAKDLALDLLIRLGMRDRETAEAVALLLSDLARTQTKKDFDRILTALVRMQRKYPDLSLPVQFI